MLSLFPSLLSLGLIGPFLLRIVLAIVVLHFAYVHIEKRQRIPVIFGSIQAVAGLLLAIGLFTQVAALILVIMFGLLMVKQIVNKAFLSDGVNYYLLLFVIALSLILTGPGAFAFDYPL
jgi:uncharacterized membrane protein YphA (DoxX/SURF4 family)